MKEEPLTKNGNLTMSETTVIIKTIGRPTLEAAVLSAKAEGFPVIVVADGVDEPLPDFSDSKLALPSHLKQRPSQVQVVRLGRRWGHYGNMAANVGAALAKTEFITFLDDDDEFVEGAGATIRKKLKEFPEVDIWCGGVRFNQDIFLTLEGGQTEMTRELSINGDKGVVPGNVAMPTYRTTIIGDMPFFPQLQPDQENYTDFFHISQCNDKGYKIDWFGEAIYNVRPAFDDSNGRGE